MTDDIAGLIEAKDVGDQMDRRIKAEAERDAIRAKMIEECDALVAQFALPNDIRRELRKAIRALAQTEDKSGN